MRDLWILSDLSALEDALASGARVVLDAGIRIGADALAHLSPEQQARLYVPPALADAAPRAQVVLECPAAGQRIFPALRRHALRFGARGAVLLRPTALHVTLRPDADADFFALPDELPGADVRFSRDALCAFTVQQHGAALAFSLFDTPKTIARRRALCRRLGLSCIVLAE